MYHSQHGEDQWIAEHLDLPYMSTFVEVGAFDGVSLSNTKHFEDRGWRGLCIEADPRSWVPLLRNRQCQCFLGAASAYHGSLEFDCVAEPSHSGFNRNKSSPLGAGDKIRVPTLPLWVLLDAYDLTEVHLLSLDTEGTELEVLQSGRFGYGWGSHRPWPQIIVIEWETAGLPDNEQAIMAYFDGHGLPYELVHRTVGNLIFNRIK